MEKEIWRPIEGYEMYLISNYGKIKRMPFYKKVCGGGKQYRPEHNMKLTKDKLGYMRVGLSDNKRFVTRLVHRLVAKAFVQNPNNYPYVNHKDENPSNNYAENLEWCTQKYNVNYGNATQKRAAKLKNGVSSKPVLQFTLDGDLLSEFPSAMEASRQLNVSVSCIIGCCNNTNGYKTAKGYTWKYKADYVNCELNKEGGKDELS